MALSWCGDSIQVTPNAWWDRSHVTPSLRLARNLFDESQSWPISLCSVMNLSLSFSVNELLTGHSQCCTKLLKIRFCVLCHRKFHHNSEITPNISERESFPASRIDSFRIKFEKPRVKYYCLRISYRVLSTNPWEAFTYKESNITFKEHKYFVIKYSDKCRFKVHMKAVSEANSHSLYQCEWILSLAIRHRARSCLRQLSKLNVRSWADVPLKLPNNQNGTAILVQTSSGLFVRNCSFLWQGLFRTPALYSPFSPTANVAVSWCKGLVINSLLETLLRCNFDEQTCPLWNDKISDDAVISWTTKLASFWCGIS